MARPNQRSLLSAMLVSFFLTGFVGFLWIGRGGLAVVFLLATLLLTLAGILAVVYGIVPGGWVFGVTTPTLLLVSAGFGLISCLCVLLFRNRGGALPWYSSGWLLMPWVLTLQGAVAAAVVLMMTSFFQTFSVPAGSMEPTIVKGDLLVAAKWNAAPRRGDVLVFRLPSQPQLIYIMRVVGLPGEHVRVSGGIPIIDGVPVSREKSAQKQVDGSGGAPANADILRESVPGGASYMIADIKGDTTLDDSGEFVIPPSNYFVLGDNRNNARDSRVWGTLPSKDVIGRAERILWNALGTPYRDRSDLRP